MPMHSEQAPRSDLLIWIDLEMSGLQPETDVIIEIATLVTDQDLAVIAEGPVLAIHQPDELLAAMDDWNRKTHGATGLIDRIRASDVTTAVAESRTLAFLSRHLAAGASPMCGNSICQDRRFLWRGMPQLEAFFHYRNLDVSSIKELAKRWRPEIADGVKKNSSHLALDDIRDSIAELQHYRKFFFLCQ